MGIPLPDLPGYNEFTPEARFVGGPQNLYEFYNDLS